MPVVGVEGWGGFGAGGPRRDAQVTLGGIADPRGRHRRELPFVPRVAGQGGSPVSQQEPGSGWEPGRYREPCRGGTTRGSPGPGFSSRPSLPAGTSGSSGGSRLCREGSGSPGRLRCPPWFQGRDREDGSGAGRGFPAPRPRPGGPSAAPRPRSARTDPCPAPPGRCLRQRLRVSGPGGRGHRDGGHRSREGAGLRPGLVCGAPLPPCPPPPHAGAGRDPPPHRCPAAAPPGGSPRPAPRRRGHPRPCTCASHACAAAAQPGGPPGEPGGAGAARAAVRGQVPSTCRCPVCCRQGEPAGKPLLPEQTAGPGQGTAEYS